MQNIEYSISTARQKIAIFHFLRTPKKNFDDLKNKLMKKTKINPILLMLATNKSYDFGVNTKFLVHPENSRVFHEVSTLLYDDIEGSYFYYLSLVLIETFHHVRTARLNLLKSILDWSIYLRL